MPRSRTAAPGEADPFDLTDDELRRLASPPVVSRGLAYEREGRVTRVLVSEGILFASVRGSERRPYQVRVLLDEEEQHLGSSCSCPYDWENFCKHSIAALRAWRRLKGTRLEGLDPSSEATGPGERLVALREELLRTEEAAFLLGLHPTILGDHIDDDEAADALDAGAEELGIFELGELLSSRAFAGWLELDGTLDTVVYALRELASDLSDRSGGRQGGSPRLPLDPAAIPAWARDHGLDEALEQPVAVLRPWSGGYAAYLIQSFPELTVADALSREALPPALRRRGGAEAIERTVRSYITAVLEARALEARRAEAWATPPAEPALGALRHRLLADLEVARQAHPVEGVLLDRSAKLDLSVDDLCLGLRGLTRHGHYGDRFEVDLFLSGFETAPLRSACTCRAGGKGTCLHRRILLEQALDVVHDPSHPLQAPLAEAISTPTWRRLVEATGRACAPTRPAEGERQRRLAWRIGAGQGGLTVQPVVQEVLKSGRWSRGRLVSAGRILERLEIAGPADVAAASSLQLARQGGHADSEALLRSSLESLTGHPHVFWDSDRGTSVQVETTTGTVELVDGPGGVAVTFRIGPRCLTGRQVIDQVLGAGAVVVEDRESNRLHVARLGREMVELVRATDSHPGPVPAEGQRELVQALAPLRGRVELRLTSALRGKRRRADPRPVLRLDPREELNLEAGLVVRPLAGGEPFEPGRGEQEVHVLSKRGTPSWAGRDLDEERRLAGELWQQLRLEPGEEDAPFHRLIDDPDEALELVAAVGQLGDEARVEWPEGVTPWQVRGASAGELKVRVRQVNDWFGVEGEVEVDGEKIPLGALLDAIRTGRRFVRLGPGRFARIEASLRKRLAGAEDVLVPRPGGGRKLAVAVANAARLGELLEGVGAVEGDRKWAELLARVEQSQRLEPQVPEGLTAELRPYQREGFEWLCRLSAWDAGACLADDMGLGKTVQTLAMLLDRRGRGPALVVAPTSVGQGWIDEARRFAPELRTALYRGPGRGELLGQLESLDLLVTSYGILALDVEHLAEVDFGTLVLDEAQAVKNARTRRAAAARRVRAPFRLALTGTPIENHLGELWSLFNTVSPGLLGSWRLFRARFARPIEADGDLARREALARLLRPFLLRRTKERVAPELPPRSEVVVPVRPSKAERRAYDAARKKAIERFLRKKTGKDDRRFEILAAITRLRRLACNPRLVEPSSTLPSAKLEAALELVERIEEDGHRALVFSQFTGHLSLLRQELDERGTSYLYLDGSTPAGKRARLVEQWQGGEGTLFLISLKAGGTGLNLTGADTVLHLDPWWNPAVEDQATDRTHRIGQTRPVTVARLVTEGTIEEAVIALHARKRDLAEGLLEGGDRAGRLTTEQLAELLRYGEGAPEIDDNGNGASETVPPELPPPLDGSALSAEDLARLARALDEGLGEELASGQRSSQGTVDSYNRSAARIVRFAETEEARAGVEARSVEGWAATYLEAVRTGAFEAPRTEQRVARTVLRRMATLAGH